MTRVRRLTAVLAVGGGLLAVNAATASAYVYWSNRDGSIGRANLDGGGARANFIVTGTDSWGVALDGHHVYWGAENGPVGRANLDGTGVTQRFVDARPEAWGVAVDGQHLYFIDNGNTIGRANLDGTGSSPDLVNAGPSVSGIAVAAPYIYWTNALGGVGRGNLDGSNVQQGFIPGNGLHATGVAVDGQHIYWADQVAGTIGRANLDGSGVNPTFITGAAQPVSVAVDSQHVYWTNYTFGSIGRANLDGSGANQRFVSDAGKPTGVAVDSLGGPPTPTDPSTKPHRVRVKPKVVGLPDHPPRIGGRLDDAAPKDLPGFGEVIKEALSVTIDPGRGPIALPARRHSGRRIVRRFTLGPGRALHFKVPALGPGVRRERVTVAVSITTKLGYTVDSSRSYIATSGGAGRQHRHGGGNPYLQVL